MLVTIGALWRFGVSASTELYLINCLQGIYYTDTLDHRPSS